MVQGKFGRHGNKEGIILHRAEKDECEKFQRISYEEFGKKNIFGHVVKIERNLGVGTMAKKRIT